MLHIIAENRCFEGLHRRYRHWSEELSCEMNVSVFLPPTALVKNEVPSLYWLSGLTCTDENVMQKAGVQRLAAQLGLAIIAPDTSPRGQQVPTDPEASWDFGHGAGFYVDAVQFPWAKNYRMYSYVVKELPSILEQTLPLNGRRSICGHSMGGHGALICALRNPDLFHSVSAFAPICQPSKSPWGKKAFRYFLGEDTESWLEWDATHLIRASTQPSKHRLPILIDQGSVDAYLDQQLQPEQFITLAESIGYPLEFRMQHGYDHSYFFVASFVDDHLRHHARALCSDVEAKYT